MILTLLYDASYAADINNPYKYAPSNDTCVVSRHPPAGQKKSRPYPEYCTNKKKINLTKIYNYPPICDPESRDYKSPFWINSRRFWAALTPLVLCGLPLD